MNFRREAHPHIVIHNGADIEESTVGVESKVRIPYAPLFGWVFQSEVRDEPRYIPWRNDCPESCAEISVY